jgi:hypothetical protein
VNSCTAAMHPALEAIGLKSGDEAITSTCHRRSAPLLRGQAGAGGR